MTEDRADLTSLQRAVIAMKEMGRRIETLEGKRSEPVAVIGMACRFPGGGDTPEKFWDLLLEGVDTVGEVPPERWDVDAYYHPDPDHDGTMNTRFGSFLEGIDRFDPHFFGMSQHEATSIDPQHRLLMEVAWEALERAGIPPYGLEESRTGVFVGITAMEYVHLLREAGAVDAYYVGGAPLCAASGRLSHLFGLQGPCMSIDTACSSALVSVHQACQSLRTGESDLALAGGVNLTITPHGTVFLSRAHMLAPDGRCKTFNASADGFVRGEGCGILVLKRLKEAQEAGNPILGVILGSGVNHDGPSNGFTAPNGGSQEALIRRAVESAGIHPHDVELVETHGTGTALGDPIEVEALGRALCQGRSEERPLHLGAVKTNVGHLESAAGAAGAIKALLAVENGQIPATIHRDEPNPYIPWDQLPVEVPGETKPWPQGGARRIAGVSAFGATGTNAHLIVAEGLAPASSAPPGHGSADSAPGAFLLPLSARSPDALVELAYRYADHLTEHPEHSLADVCHTAATGRSHFEHRLAIVAGSAEEAAARLWAFAGDPTGEGSREFDGIYTGVVEGHHPPPVGLFLEGRTIPPEELEALQQIPVFARAYQASREDRDPSAELDRLRGEFALARLWRDWGVRPSRIAGVEDGIRTAELMPEIPFLSQEGAEGIWEGFREAGVSFVVATGDGWRDGEDGGRQDGEDVPECIPSRGSGGAVSALLEGASRLWVRGVPVDLPAVQEGSGGQKVVLPTYPFQRIRCWPDVGPFKGPEVRLGEGAGTLTGSKPGAAELGEILAHQLQTAGDTLVRVVEEQLAALAGGMQGRTEKTEPGTLNVSSDRSPSPSSPPAAVADGLVSLGDWHLLMLSGSCDEELEARAHQLAEAGAADPDVFFRGESSDHLPPPGPSRKIVVFRTPDEAAAGLTRPEGAPGHAARGTVFPESPSVAFMLPGLGDHYVGMAQGLYRLTGGFRKRFDRCADILQPRLGVDLREVLFSPEAEAESSSPPTMDLAAMLGRSTAEDVEASHPLRRIAVAHSSIFSVEYALAGLWEDWGVSPQALLGFSLGEIVGATLAGVMSLRDGLTLVAHRAGVIETLPKGAMTTVLLGQNELKRYLNGKVSVAVRCAPTVQVVAGAPEAVGELEGRLADDNILSRRLQSDFAFHTPAMEGQEGPVRTLAGGMSLRPPQIPVCSNTSGRWLSPDEATDPSYWAQHTMLAVEFAQGVERLLETDGQVIVEVGPGQSLTSFALQSLSMERVSSVEFVPSLRGRHEVDSDAAVFLRSLGRLWISGIQISQPDEEA